MGKNRLSNFSNGEIYLLKRALLDAKCCAAYANYGDRDKKAYNKLLMEFVKEDTRRIVGDDK